jgi:hypothetical protein
VGNSSAAFHSCGGGTTDAHGIREPTGNDNQKYGSEQFRSPIRGFHYRSLAEASTLERLARRLGEPALLVPILPAKQPLPIRKVQVQVQVQVWFTYAFAAKYSHWMWQGQMDNRCTKFVPEQVVHRQHMRLFTRVNSTLQQPTLLSSFRLLGWGARSRREGSGQVTTVSTCCPLMNLTP